MSLFDSKAKIASKDKFFDLVIDDQKNSIKRNEEMLDALKNTTTQSAEAETLRKLRIRSLETRIEEDKTILQRAKEAKEKLQ